MFSLEVITHPKLDMICAEIRIVIVHPHRPVLHIDRVSYVAESAVRLVDEVVRQLLDDEDIGIATAYSCCKTLDVYCSFKA